MCVEGISAPFLFSLIFPGHVADFSSQRKRKKNIDLKSLFQILPSGLFLLILLVLSHCGSVLLSQRWCQKRGLSHLHHCSRHRGVDLRIILMVGSFHLIFRLTCDEGESDSSHCCLCINKKCAVYFIQADYGSVCFLCWCLTQVQTMWHPEQLDEMMRHMWKKPSVYLSIPKS